MSGSLCFHEPLTGYCGIGPMGPLCLTGVRLLSVRASPHFDAPVRALARMPPWVPPDAAEQSVSAHFPRGEEQPDALAVRSGSREPV